MDTTIHLKKVFGTECLTAHDGKQLYEVLSQNLEHKTPITVDFGGVKTFATPFFNASFGRLVERLRPAQLLERVTCLHIKKETSDMLDRVLDKADRYFRDDEYRRAIGESTDRLLSGN